MSLRQLSDWCADRFSASPVTCFPTSDLRPRPFDLPWVVLDHSLAGQFWNWQPTTTVDQILEEIAAFAVLHPDWIATSA
jgi:CDP-paratose 2-epimerase